MKEKFIAEKGSTTRPEAGVIHSTSHRGFVFVSKY